ncbi:hypothetical protein [Entomohabitans teleogrylli]|uniref:hypothetical protein n=1 Tax=Entomohabitans teleogrylli TaxID=1384589 RepID=UPI00073DB0B9|nr:hypothetical protein [Entomohabitans teleogrylli]
MKQILVGIAAVLLVGCSSVGGEDKFSASYLRANIIVNKTTQAEVQRLYGVPDKQDTHSSGSNSWTYFKKNNLNLAGQIASYIPGASSLSGAISSVQAASSAADTASSASAKVTGDTEHRGDYLRFDFNEQKVVTHWYL